MKIVVITPTRNESWILRRFLQVSSRFADNIIIADQMSTDDTAEIASGFPKVTLIHNQVAEYDEAQRQALLIQKAREVVPGRKIILALDADEILAANATATAGWKTMLSAAPGSVLCFEKPELYITPDQCIRYDRPWPLGYVDDGGCHRPTHIHSIRIPMPLEDPRLLIHDVKVLHYALLRTGAQRAKMRLYACVENILGTGGSLPGRRNRYGPSTDYASRGKLGVTPKEWVDSLEADGIDMRSVQVSRLHWQDDEVLRLFGKHGCGRFYNEAIWDVNWEELRRQAMSRGLRGVPTRVITPPSREDVNAVLP